MTNENNNIPNSENPSSFTGLKKGTLAKTAAGPKAIIVSAKHIIKEAGAKRGFKALYQLNKYDGFICPSCAWPDPDDERSDLGEYCENGAKAVAEEATTKKLTRSFFAKNSIQQLAQLSDYEIGKGGRIAQPMFLPKGATHYQPITWENAFQKISTELNNLQCPDEAIFYTSGRTSNEAAFLYQLFVREYDTN